MRLPSQTGAVKAEPRASRLYSVPGSGLSAKSSHVAVAAAVDEILALYATPESNLRGARAAELQDAVDGENARAWHNGSPPRAREEACRAPLALWVGRSAVSA